MADVEVIKARSKGQVRRDGRTIEQLRVAAYCRVSTDNEEQLESYKSQVRYYTEKIQSNKDWHLAGIYADEAVTGTMVDHRENFQRLIQDAIDGKVDLIITKSISRFARNTLDVLKYVRMLRDHNIAIFFEEENINTSTMDGELLLSVLSAVYQQEVENTSANVKKGLKMKMQRGELIGFQGCLGYDYHVDTKTITINEDEAKLVRYIFRRYLEGTGGHVIGQELEQMGAKTKRGKTTWTEGTVLGIIKNEKYKGDILMGKTFTVNPITKKRLANFGEEDKFYIKEHHEPIVSAEVFEQAQDIRNKRNLARKGMYTEGERVRISRRFAFSSMLECGYCGASLSRRSWHSGSSYQKTMWQCSCGIRKGKKHCPDSKGILEKIVEQAFVESYHMMCKDNESVLDEFLQRTNGTLIAAEGDKAYEKAAAEVAAMEDKVHKLIDLRLEEVITKDDYEEKYDTLQQQLSIKKKIRDSLLVAKQKKISHSDRMEEFRKVLDKVPILKKFDRNVFESIIEKVMIGGYDKDGTPEPSMITFVYKTGLQNSIDGEKFKPDRKNAKKSLKAEGDTEFYEPEVERPNPLEKVNQLRDLAISIVRHKKNNGM